MSITHFREPAKNPSLHCNNGRAYIFPYKTLTVEYQGEQTSETHPAERKKKKVCSLISKQMHLV